ncbi:Fujikurins efflux protein, partial [Lachnellula cervina]
MNDNEMRENPVVGNGAGSGSGSAGAGEEKKSESKTALSDSDNEKEKTAGSEDRSISASMEGSVEEVEVDAETGIQENNHDHEKLANGNGVTEGFGNDVEAPAPVSVLSTPAANASANANEVPNGGLTAWLQVLGSFFLMMNCWGILNTFGVYQTFYSTPSSSSSSSPLNRPPTSTSTSASPSSISWIGSTQAFLLLFISALTGPLFDAGYFRHLLATGSFLIVFGMVMTSVASRYWEVMLAQAVCVGLGAGCLFVPGVSILPTYFSSRKAVATGLATSGSSLGGILYPIIFYKLEPRIGFGWATRVIAFIALATLSISAATMRVRVLPPAKRR